MGAVADPVAEVHQLPESACAVLTAKLPGRHGLEPFPVERISR